MHSIETVGNGPRYISETKPSGCGFGRIFTKIASVAYSIAKVSLLVGATLPIAAAASMSALAHHMNPGAVLARKGTASCPNIHDVALCELKTVKHLANHQIFNDLELENAGEYGVTRYEGSNPLYFLLPGKKFTNMEKAFNYVERSILSDMNALQQGPKEVCSTIASIYGILSEDPQFRTYRKGIKLVFPIRPHGLTALEFVQARLGENREEYKKFEEVYIRLLANKPACIASQDIAVLNRAIFVPTMPGSIPSEMELFAKELAERMKLGGDYVDHASFAHDALTRISPYNRVVRRLAWVVANSVLAIGKEHPLVFENREEYDKKVREGTKNRTVLTDYFRKSIEWTKKTLPHLDFLSDKCFEEACLIVTNPDIMR